MQRKIALISDVHANFAALSAVIDDVYRRTDQPTAFWMLGDLVGRGPNPVDTMHSLWRLYRQQMHDDQAAWLAGNHDLGVLDKVPTGQITQGSNTSSVTGQQIGVEMMVQSHRIALNANDPSMLYWLDSLKTYANPFPGVYLAHGTYTYERENGAYAINYAFTYGRYGFGNPEVREQFYRLTLAGQPMPRLIVNGHTHTPRLATWNKAAAEQGALTDVVPLFKVGGHHFNTRETPLYINPGSVGFARKRIREGSCQTDQPIFPTFALLTTDEQFLDVTVEFRCVPYNQNPNSYPNDFYFQYRRELEQQKGCYE